MLIHRNMTESELAQLAEHMGTDATVTEAGMLARRALEVGHTNTCDIPEGDWLGLCEQSAREMRLFGN